MKQSKQLFAKVLGTILVVLMFSSTVFAGGGPEPPAGATITGPEIWGVVVMNCDGGTGTLRVKRVVDCNTETVGRDRYGLANVDPSNCPIQASTSRGLRHRTDKFSESPVRLLSTRLRISRKKATSFRLMLNSSFGSQQSHNRLMLMPASGDVCRG